MPLYEYLCEKCQQLHEVVQKFSDPPEAECPVCHSAMRKQMSMGSFSLKGTGWYVTDYKKSGSGAKGEGSSSK